MTNDKDTVLTQIRASLKTAHLPAARANVPKRLPVEQGNTTHLVERFRRELEPIGGTSYLAENDEEAIDIVLNILREAGGTELLTWSEEEIPLRGLGDALRINSYTRRDIKVVGDAAGRMSKLMELEGATAGITGAQAGLADTGSLALVSSPARPRLASLLPPVHIALLETSRLFPDMASFFAAYPNVTREGSNLVFVTGPSRTADIEMTLQRGVHGPKFVHVVLLTRH